MNPFDQAIETLPAALKDLLALVPDKIKKVVNEIRIRVGKPIVLVCWEKRFYFLDLTDIQAFLFPEGFQFLKKWWMNVSDV